MEKIDLNSKEFLDELEKTKKFTSKVCDSFNYVYNPNEEVNITIQQGLTRNKLIYGKRYCPCFMVIGKNKEEQKKVDNRVCPCTPGTKIEIPNDGKCHCGIFCTKEHALELEKEMAK